jgi:hypothetical protein
MLLTGDATATDPVCTLAPRHDLVEAVIGHVDSTPYVDANWVYRIDPPSAVERA